MFNLIVSQIYNELKKSLSRKSVILSLFLHKLGYLQNLCGLEI